MQIPPILTLALESKKGIMATDSSGLGHTPEEMRMHPLD